MNFLLDNNLPAQLAHSLAALSLAELGVESVVHLTDVFPPATEDLVWIPGLSAHGSDWYVISQDKFRKSRGAERYAGLGTQPMCLTSRGRISPCGRKPCNSRIGGRALLSTLG